jgi:transposase
MTGMLFLAKNCCTTSDVWLGVNAPRHTLLAVQQFFAEESIPVITQPPYSPDLAPSDIWLFPSLKTNLKGTRFTTMEDIEYDD